MLEAHVGQLPQHVVQQDQAAVVRGRAAGSSSHSTWSAAPGGRAVARHRSTGWWRPTPGPAASRDRTTAIVGRAEGDQHVARRGRWPAARRPDRGRRAHRRQRPLAHDHRVDELHRDVAGVLGPGRRRHHIVAPAAKRRARARAARARSSPRPASSPAAPATPCRPCPPRRQREHAPLAARDATDPAAIPFAAQIRETMSTTSTSELAACPASGGPSWKPSPRRRATRSSAHDGRAGSPRGTGAPSGSSGTSRPRSSGSRSRRCSPTTSAPRSPRSTRRCAGDTVDHVETEVQRESA